MSASRCTHPECQVRCPKCGMCSYLDGTSLGKGYHAPNCGSKPKPPHQEKVEQ